MAPLLAADRPLPETQSLSAAQYNLVLYVLVVAAFALFASFLYSWTSRNEVSARYRPAVLASLMITAVAFASYVVLFLKIDTGYDRVGAAYRPNAEALLTFAPRYMDWSVTVPLLTVELLAVCAVTGAAARSLRFTTMAAAFLMILTGYLGAHVVDEGASTAALWIWGIISTVFYAYLYVALWRAMRSSLSSMGEEAGASLRNATILLLSVFGVYPLAYAARVFFEGAGVTTALQIAFSAADVAAKAGFGALIHKVAKLRTAEDLRSGEDTNPEPVWISNVKKADGVQPTVRSVASLRRFEQVDLTALDGRSGRVGDPLPGNGTATGRV
jgi:bacteriorhodopsin